MAPRHRSTSKERRSEDSHFHRRKSPARDLDTSPPRRYRASSPSSRQSGQSQRRSRSPRSFWDQDHFRTRSVIASPQTRHFETDNSYPHEGAHDQSRKRGRTRHLPYEPHSTGRRSQRSRSHEHIREGSQTSNPRGEGRRTRASTPRHSPDTHTARGRYRSRSPVLSGGRPGYSRYERDSTVFSQDKLHRRTSKDIQAARSSDTNRGREQRPTRRDYLSRSPTPEYLVRDSRDHSRARSRKNCRRSPSRDKLGSDMRSSYPHSGGASSRSGRPPSINTTYYHGHSPYYSASPQGHSPYQRNDWPSHHSYPPNYHGSSPHPAQGYRQNSYPPPPHSPSYFQPPAHTPYNGPPHGGGVSPAPSPYRGGYDRHHPNHPAPSDRRQSNSSLERYPSAREGSARGRGHYTNLSWTPATGSRGGIQVPPRSRATTQQKEDETVSNDNTIDNEEDDNPFRPSKDLQVEDQSAKEYEDAQGSSQPISTATKSDSNGETKFRFTLKSKTGPMITNPSFNLSDAKHNPLSAKPKSVDTNPLTNKQPYKTEVKLDRRYIYSKEEREERGLPPHNHEAVNNKARRSRKGRHRPSLPPDLAASDSVYHRKPGNGSVVGSGTYGKVFRAVHVYTGEMVALKKIRMEGERDGFPVTAIREVKLLQSLHHDNIVTLHEVMVEKNDCYMVFEYLSHDLTGLLNHPTFQLENSHKKDLAKQLFDGLDYLHRRGVLHRDIKAANILISNKGQLKLADFGLARFYAKRRQLDYTNRVITIWYRSPELLLGETQYDAAVDIWSAACVLVEIFTKHAIFPGDGGEINQLDRIYDVLGTPTRAEWPEVVDMAWFELLRPTERKASTFADKYRDRVSAKAFELLSSMFSYNPRKRPSAAEVLEHPFFKEEEPRPRPASELQALEGDWHEFESKALRKEKERLDREARKLAREQDAEASQKRAGEQEDSPTGYREAKRPKIRADGEAFDSSILL